MAKTPTKTTPAFLTLVLSVFLIAGFLSISCPYQTQTETYSTTYAQLDGYQNAYPSTYSQCSANNAPQQIHSQCSTNSNAYPSTNYQYSTTYVDAYPRCSYMCSGSGNYPGQYNNRYRGQYETVVVTNPDPIEFNGYHQSNDWWNQYPTSQSSYHYSLSSWW